MTNYHVYSNKVDRYDLAPGFSLQRANNKEFVKSWAVYRNINEDFSQNYAEIQKELEGVTICFWILQSDLRVGGVVMLPNGIGDIFLIPPEDNPKRILSVLVPLLEHWSDKHKTISAQAIAPQFVEAFQQVGFVIGESRCWMIRPTAPLTVEWSSKWIITPLDPTKASDIAALFKDAFTGGLGGYGQRTFEAHLASVTHFFESYIDDSDCGQVSALVFEARSGCLAAVCMVEMHKGLPTVRFVAVAPGYQRRGLATKLMKRAINLLALKYDWVKLAVTDGNPAVAIYRNLGFLPGDTLYELTKPASH